MNIGIDARLLNNKVTGINRFLRNIVKYIPSYDTVNNYFLYAYQDVELRDDFYKIITVNRNRFPRQLQEHYWLNFLLPHYLAEQNIDLFFTPYILTPYRRGAYKSIIVIHDVMTKTCPQFFSTYYKKYMDVIVPPNINRSDAIVTISESARKDILKYYNVEQEKVHVINLWADEKYKPVNLVEKRRNIPQQFNLPEKFILYVGAIEERKNIRGILKISDILFSKGVDVKFVLVGKKSFGFNELYDEIIKRKERVIYFEYVEENILPILYNLSTLFLFPSYYEGFGIPPLEAMQCGIPVLTSNNSSLPEVVGSGGILIDADDSESFARHIIKLLNEKTVYNTMKIKAIQQSEKFTPDKEIPKLLNLFNEVIFNKSGLRE